MKTVITARYSSGTFLARNRDSGKTATCTESENGAVLALARKLLPEATGDNLRQISSGVWVLQSPEAEPRGGL